MAKEQIVQDAMAELQAAQVQVLGDVYDKSFAEGVASVPVDGDVQAKIDAAVAQAKAEDQAALEAVQAQLSDLQVLELSKEQQVETLQAIVDKIKALLP